jgi:light-regulated signal transduction histidine kinase (bacteriophytochrome)
VAGFTQILALEYADKLDTAAQEYLGYAVEGAKQMQVLINQLLEYSRLSTGRKPLAMVDGRMIYETALANLKVAIEESGAVPTCDPLPQVMGDGPQLIQVFQNLLANAIKFRRGHGPRIHVWSEPKDKEWQFAVRDNGIGIDPRNFERVFLIFQRLHRREEYSGTGIGLAICKKIVDLHRGRIWVESQAGAGSTFYFTIPMADPD